MSEQVGQYRVSRKAVDYLLERMWLTRELEGPLRDQLATDRWEHWAVAWDAASVERLERFTTGWGRRTAPLPAPTVVEAMSALGPSAIWLVPHPAARPSDPFLTAYGRRYLQSEEAVYLACRDPTAEEVLATWQLAAFAAGRIGVVTTMAEHDPLSMVDLHEAARGVRLIVTDAYDGEGFLCYSRALTALLPDR
jgi:hypothetical protein